MENATTNKERRARRVLVRTELARRDMSARALAKKIKASPLYVQNVITGSVPFGKCQPTWRKIEDFLGVEIVSTAAELSSRKQRDKPHSQRIRRHTPTTP